MRCRNPKRVALCGSVLRHEVWDKAKRGLIETLGRRPIGGSPPGGKACERTAGEIPTEAFAGQPWKGETQGSIQSLVD